MSFFDADVDLADLAAVSIGSLNSNKPAKREKPLTTSLTSTKKNKEGGLITFLSIFVR